MKPARRILTREALLNTVSYTMMTLILSVTAFVVGVIVPGAAAWQTYGIAAEHSELIDRGYGIWRVQSQRPFDVAQCDALRLASGVRDAGAVLNRQSREITALPGASIDVLRATPGYIRIVWNLGFDAVPTVGVGSEASTRLGLRTGEQLAFFASPKQQHLELTVRQVFGPAERIRGANQVLVVATFPTGQTRECLVEADPGARSAVEAYLLSEFGASGVVSALYAPQGTGKTPEAQLRERLTLWLPPLAALTTGLIALILQYVRRADWALYQLLGAGRGGILQMLIWETAFTVWLPFAVGATTILVKIALDAPQDFVVTEVTADLLRAALMLLMLPVAEFLLLVRKDTLNWLKGQ